MPTIQTISQLTETTAAQITHRNANNGTRSALIAKLNHMLPFLDQDEADLRALTEGTIAKLQRITDKEFAGMELCPDYDK